MKLGETICRLRTKAGLSQNDLAQALEVSRQSVSKWETGASVPELDKLVKMAGLFGVSLDELVKGKAPEPQPEQAPACPLTAAPAPAQAPAPASAQAPTAPGRTPAQKAGIGFLVFSAAAALLSLLLFGALGIFLILPALVAGLILLFCKKHPVLKACWTLFLLLDVYMDYATGIRASAVLMTFRWSSQLNYARLAMAWVLFLMIAALVAGTAFALRKEGQSGSKKQKALMAAAVLVYFAGQIPAYLPQQLRLMLGGFLRFVFLIASWAQLWAVTVLAVFLARYLFCRKQRENQAL